ncbi:MAG: hypothetical protein HFJ75_08965 [Eggerthellaceae bacterium]|nr:hypothetical protein [Eggerthellaceae bacterium]
MGCHRRGDQRLVGDDRGQATVEYAVVAALALGALVAGSLLARALGGGLLVEHALMAATHHAQLAAGWAADVFCY